MPLLLFLFNSPAELNPEAVMSSGDFLFLTTSRKQPSPWILMGALLAVLLMLNIPHQKKKKKQYFTAQWPFTMK